MLTSHLRTQQVLTTNERIDLLEKKVIKIQKIQKKQNTQLSLQKQRVE
jgi:hypothetical protein